MVDSTFIVMLSSFFAFCVGRMAGRVESMVIITHRFAEIIEAIKKVETLAQLKGEDISKLPTNELVYRTQKQLQVKNED